MKDIHILKSLSCNIDIHKLLKKMHVLEGTCDAMTLKCMADEAKSVAKPKAMYRIAYINERGKDYIIVEEHTFTSRVLAVNLEHAHRIFCYAITCGTELDEWSRTKTDMLENYWADEIKEAFLRSAYGTFNDSLKKAYRLGKTAWMNPGSLEDWPISEQRILFSLLGDTKTAIGIELTDSYLMSPIKSLSGIRFPTEEHFESCQLCTREICPGRRANYDKTLFYSKYYIE